MLLLYKFHGSSKREILFFNLASCEPHLGKFEKKSIPLNPRLTKRCGYNPPPPLGFSQPLQNAKESNLRHIDNLFNIFSGHFDEKKGVPPYPGVG